MSPLPRSIAVEAWASGPVAAFVDRVRRQASVQVPSATAHKRWRDELPGAGR